MEMKELGQELNKILYYKSIELPVGPCDMLRLRYKISEWIEQRRQDILIAWWAEYGFEPGRAVIVTDARDHTSYVRRATDEEMEQHKNTLIQNKNPIVDELVEKILDADNKGLTLHDAQEIVMLAKQLKK